MKIKLIKRKNPINQEEKYYASPINDGKVNLDDIAEQISGRSTTTYGDILSVLQNLVEFIPFLLLMGKSVSLGNLGTLRISFSGEGTTNPADFDVSMIKTVRTIFVPGVKLKKKISDIKFETIR